MAIELYERGLRILDSEITRLNKGEEKDKLKQERIEALRSVTEVYISDMTGTVYLNKARDLIFKLLKDESNLYSSYDVFLLAQVYDKLGKKYKSVSSIFVSTESSGMDVVVFGNLSDWIDFRKFNHYAKLLQDDY